MVSKELVLSFQFAVNASDSSIRERESCFALDRRHTRIATGSSPRDAAEASRCWKKFADEALPEAQFASHERGPGV